MIKCFLIVPTRKSKLYFRRYVSGSKCSVHGYHDAMVLFNITDLKYDKWAHDDVRWPKRCDCGYVFQESDTWQLFSDSIWKRTDTGEELTLREAPPGTMWDADWLHDIPNWCGFDGKSIMVRLPDGRTWHIDGRADNCKLPNDTKHRCWIRHGEPPLLTVDKNGLTCNAGGGSIQSSNWHGFLRDGNLVDA